MSEKRRYLCDVLRYFMKDNNMTTTDMADASDVSDIVIRNLLTNDPGRVSTDSIKRVLKVMGVSEEEVTIVKPSVRSEVRSAVQSSLKYILSIHKDGATKYCCSYSPEITVDTIYWSSPTDDRMACPYGFRSYKQATWAFHAWKERVGAVGWRYEITEGIK